MENKKYYWKIKINKNYLYLNKPKKIFENCFFGSKIETENHHTKFTNEEVKDICIQCLFKEEWFEREEVEREKIEYISKPNLKKGEINKRGIINE